jgi:phosphoribosyl-ATP pyrophosphatase (EC 3.6.1.31)/phosphoribosyl-AMP cyclohydrolase (EC 3.5.4.19)
MKLDFDKNNGLIPAVIQDARTQGGTYGRFYEQEAYQKTVDQRFGNILQSYPANAYGPRGKKW